MEDRQYLEAAVRRAGGVSAAAARWGVPYPSLASVINGWRGVSPSFAKRLANGSDGELDPSILIWIRAKKRPITQHNNIEDAGNG